MDKKASIVFDTKRSLERLKNGTGTPKYISRIGVAHTFFFKQGVFSGPTKKHVRNLPSISLLNKSYENASVFPNNQREILGKSSLSIMKNKNQETLHTAEDLLDS